MTVIYDDAVSGIDPSTLGIDDITVSNGATVTGFFVVGNTVTYTVAAPGGTWAASPQGPYTIALVPGSVKDRAGNPVAGNPNLGSFLNNAAIPGLPAPAPEPPPEAAPPGPRVIAAVVMPFGGQKFVFAMRSDGSSLFFTPFGRYQGPVTVSVVVGEIVAVAFAGRAAHVKIFNPQTGALAREFFVVTGLPGGAAMVAGDLDGDGKSELFFATPGGGVQQAIGLAIDAVRALLIGNVGGPFRNPDFLN